MKHVYLALGAFALLLGIFFLAQFVLPYFLEVSYEQGDAFAKTKSSEQKKENSIPKPPPVDTREVIQHIPLPDAQKVIYMTSCVVGTPSVREGLVKFIENSEVNSLIIDIKDFSGTLSFKPASDEWQPAWDNARCGARDMKEFVAELHKKGIYVIGRITVFQDPFYTSSHPEDAVKKQSDGTVWKDHKGLAFIDVSAQPYRSHLIQLAVDSYNIGFDELNFDYIRYPSDGNMKDIAFKNTETATKQGNLESFFKYLHGELSKPELFNAVNHMNTGRERATPYLSADLFGMTTTNTDDLSIGQVLERALPYFDFIAPMVYPSHYPDGYMGFSDPNQHVYAVVNHAMTEAVRRTVASTTHNEGFAHTERIGTSTPALYTKPVYEATKMRPWLQDFDYGGTYDVAEVQAQIKATYDAGLTSWMIWDPGNHYTRGAFKAEEVATGGFPRD